MIFSGHPTGRAGTLVLLAALALLTACVQPPRPDGINDPFEPRNRRVHEFNKALDSGLVKPTSKAYDSITPDPVVRGVDNFAANLALPGMIANNLLQLELADAFVNLARFAMNSTIGLAGVFDVATQNGLTEQTTDFGETLFVWGVPEGRYVELPFFGASTERDTAGLVVDFVLDPSRLLLPRGQRWLGPTAYVLNRLGDRSRYSDLVESIFYESADSYAQARLLYLQNRRKELYGSISDADLEDPYADF